MLLNEQYKKIIELINLYCLDIKNEEHILEELDNYVEKNNIILKDINNENFDILLYVIYLIINRNVDKKASSATIESLYTKDSYNSIKIINFIILHCQYKNLNYIKIKNRYEIPVFTVISNSLFKIADLLQYYGADINYKIKTDNNDEINIIEYLIKNCTNKKLNYILHRNFNIEGITSRLINKIIFKNENLLVTIFEHYIYDNDFILYLLSLHKNKTSIANKEFRDIVNKERNKISIDDSMYDTAIKWGHCDSAKLLLDYDTRDSNTILKLIEKYNMLESAITFTNYPLAEKILNYQDFDIKNINVETILSKICHNSKGENLLILLIEKLNSINFDFNSINIEKILIGAREYGNIEILKYLMTKIILKVPSIDENNIDISKIENSNIPYLILVLNIAITIGNLNLVKNLVESDELKIQSNINSEDSSGNIPIIVALYAYINDYYNMERQKNCSEIFKYLLDHGANCNITDSKNNSLLSMVMMNKNNMITKYFLRKEIVFDENTIDSNYSLPFIHALYQNQMEEVESLIQTGEYTMKRKVVNHKNYFTPLAFSYLMNYKEIFNILLNYFDINEKDGYKNTILYYAIHKEDLKTIKYLIDKGAEINFGDNSALDIAIKIGNKEIFDIILGNKEINFNSVNSQLETPFSVIIKSKYYSIDEKVKMIECLIKRGFNVNKPDGYRKSALSYAIEEESLPIIKLLVENGSNVNFIGGNGNLPLGIAIEKKLFPVVKLLVENGAYINTTMNDRNNDKMRYKNNIPILLHAIKTGEVNIIKYLIDNYPVPEIQNLQESHLLIEALYSTGNIELFEYFLKKNIILFNSELIKIFIWNNKLNLIKLIIPKYIDVNQKDNEGNSFLANSIIVSNIKLIKYFISCGADLRSINHDNQSIHDINMKYNYKYNKNNYEKIEKILIK